MDPTYTGNGLLDDPIAHFLFVVIALWCLFYWIRNKLGG